MKILQIMCHPDYNGKHRVSNILAEIGEDKFPSLSLRKKNNRQKTRNTKVKSLLFFIFVLL